MLADGYVIGWYRCLFILVRVVYYQPSSVVYRPDRSVIRTGNSWIYSGASSRASAALRIAFFLTHFSCEPFRFLLIVRSFQPYVPGLLRTRFRGPSGRIYKDCFCILAPSVVSSPLLLESCLFVVRHMSSSSLYSWEKSSRMCPVLLQR
jgi:hypothetical protein